MPAAPPILAPVGATFAELETVYVAYSAAEALTIRVASNGCTEKDDFAFYVERKGEAVTLAFGRKAVDRCKIVSPTGARGYVDLTFTWAELGVGPSTPVFLLNPLRP